MTSGEERPAKIPKFDIQVSSSEDEKWSKYVNKEKKETFTMSFKKKIFEHYSHKESVELHKVGNTSTFTEEFQFVEKDAKCDLVPSCEVYVDQEEENDGVRTWSKQVETEELYEKVREIDPISGQKIHPNDRRKIVRALEVYEQYGVPMSAILKRQHDDMPTEVQAVSGPLRYSNSCVLWIQCKQDVLDDRLDRRVDSMLESGLLQELATFHKLYNQARLKESRPPDYTLGIFQSIGFKEFHEYLILPENIRDTEKGKELLQRGIEDLKRTTRRYSRKQTRWIRNRFLKRPGNISLPVYALNFTDLTRWEEMVYRPATQIVQAFIENKQPDRKPVVNEGDRNHRYTYNVCEVCDGRIFVNENDWKAHINGKKHKKMVKRKKKEELSNGDTQDSQQMVDENPAS